MRKFSARETEWLKELDGIELASFWQRAIAFCIDGLLLSVVFSLLALTLTAGYLGLRRLEGRPVDVDAILHGKQNYHFSFGEGPAPGDSGPKTVSEEVVQGVGDVVVPVLYFGVLLWKGKGRTPGKRVMKIRVVSVMHRHLSFWHSVERSLGYGAAMLELGFGFLQFFIHPYRRCAQDRLAETIVVTERSYQALQHRLSHPLIPDTTH